MKKCAVVHALAAAALLVLAGCGTTTPDPLPEAQRERPERRVLVRGPALIEPLIPARVTDRRGWAEDMHLAMDALGVAPTAENVCAVIAVVEQESGYRVDPAVPGLGAMARRELERRRERAGVPKLVVDSALSLASSDGRSYKARLDAARTERQLSDIFEDLAERVPLGKALFAEHNPVKTGGPMQVSIPFAQLHAEHKRYPFKAARSVRDEVFTRRGGLYFGIAHLFDYRAPYDDMRYRFADYNAGRYASRNAAFQKAVGELIGVELDLDGDLLRYENGKPAREASRTEVAARRLAAHFEMSAAEVRQDLELGQGPELERSRLYLSVFTLADGVARRRAPRAVVPSIVVESFKTTRRLTSGGYAARVSERYRGCLAQL
jgi:hypothetical protein